MSQEQPKREDYQEEAITYGDVFNVQGDLKTKPIAPVDAATMQKVESHLLGKNPKGGVAATMQSAAMKNERDGVVGHNDINITATGMVDQFSKKAPLTSSSSVQDMGIGGGGITIGEALEATVLTAGKKPVEWSDAAAIQAAEVRATGRTNIVPGGVAAAAQSAATLNARITKEEDKTKLGDILADATSKLPSDRAATRRDAEGVTGAEMRNDPNLTTHTGGVSAAVAAAARLNQMISN
ncbi:late embryogenesis abundant protein 47-like [Vigna radiata var. radiata]|uniref:Late embryogenesis abundant protein 47-like n=1 Tax=Vigna radiata var. radiata TaxID=3916 RepID=A0A1S3V0K1_VIGRR|nr:late embryogenesis abundant protein 47-like [Vigna radiata var. radiata]